jgi:hypothetical protein
MLARAPRKSARIARQPSQTKSARHGRETHVLPLSVGITPGCAVSLSEMLRRSTVLVASPSRTNVFEEGSCAARSRNLDSSRRSTAGFHAVMFTTATPWTPGPCRLQHGCPGGDIQQTWAACPDEISAFPLESAVTIRAVHAYLSTLTPWLGYASSFWPTTNPSAMIRVRRDLGGCSMRIARRTSYRGLTSCGPSGILNRLFLAGMSRGEQLTLVVLLVAISPCIELSFPSTTYGLWNISTIFRISRRINRFS